MKKRYALGLLLGLFFSSSSPAYSQEKKIISLKKVTSDQGLSSYYITKIIRDFKGFFWIGTQEGLVRYDGKTFLTFSSGADEKHRLGSTYISDIIEDKQRGCIYALTSYGDVTVIDVRTAIVKKRITIDNLKRNLSEKWLRCLYLQNNILWIGTSKGAYAYDLDRDIYLNITLKSNGSIEAFNVAKISEDEQGQIWLFCNEHGILLIGKKLNEVDNLKITTSLKDDKTSENKFLYWDVSFHENKMYAATSKGLQEYNRVNNKINILPTRKVAILRSSEILCLAFSSANIMWFSANSNFYKYDLATDKIIEYHEETKSDDWCSYVYQAFYDKISNTVWLGTQAGIASFSLEQGPFKPFYESANSEIKIKLAYSLDAVNDSVVYCGDENGLFRVSVQSHEIKKIDKRALNMLLFRDGTGRLLVGNRKGVFLVDVAAANVVRYSYLNEINDDQLNSCVKFNDSLIAFGSFIQKGLHIWNTNSNKITTYHDSLKNRIKDLTIINNLFKGSAPELYILTEKSIIEFNPLTKTYKSHYIKKQDGNGVYGNYMDMLETAGSYWIATYGSGLLHVTKDFQIKSIYSTKNNLCNNCVYKVFDIGDSVIVATTNKGLAVISDRKKLVKNYYKSDGLNASEFQQYCATEGNGKIYAGGVNGFTIIDPKYFTTNPTPPKFYFTNIKTQTNGLTVDTSDLEIKELKIPNNWLQTNISFVGINYSNPDRVKYQYRIKERSDKWSDPSTQNFVSLIGLSPGTYTLEAKAANEDGVWCQPKTLLLTFLPKWYQTIWFDIALALAVSGILYAFYRYRISQLKKQQEIRVGIASDLHDDIGSALNTVKVFTHLAKRDVQKEEHLSQIEESLTQATIGLRDMIWILDDSQDTLQEIMERIKKFALPVTNANSINFECSAETAEGENRVSKTKKRNLLLIAKESINNCVKYAQCKNIQVMLQQKKHKITLIIKDDGVGFDAATASQGYGLKNIQHRAKQMNCTAEIISAKGEGTTIKIMSKP